MPGQNWVANGWQKMETFHVDLSFDEKITGSLYQICSGYTNSYAGL